MGTKGPAEHSQQGVFFERLIDAGHGPEAGSACVHTECLHLHTACTPAMRTGVGFAP